MRFSTVKYLLREGFRNVWSNRMMSLVSIGILVVCLILTGAAGLVSVNVSRALSTVEGNNSITVYLSTDISTLEAMMVGQKIKETPNIKSCEFYSKEDAMKKYEDVLGSLFTGLEGSENPLPDAFRITMDDLSLYKETVDNLSNINGVDSISDRSGTAEKLTKLNTFVTTAEVLVVLILGAVSLFIISNTIKVTMYSRRLEISVMKSVGATNWFIRVPFIVEGIIIGLVSALISILFLRLVYNGLIVSIDQVVPFTHISFDSLALPLSLSFLIVGIAFGLIGGIITIEKYLKKEGGDIIGW